MISFPRRTAVALVLVAGSFALGAGAADAADPTPAPASAVINYDGTGTVTDDEGSVFSYPVTWTVDCTSTPCTITGVLSDTNSGDTFPLTGGILQPFIGGKGTYSYGESGDRCAGTWIGPYTLTIVASGNQITTAFDIPGGGDVDCADGTSVEYDGAHVDITTTVTSGDTCHIFATCSTPTATPVAISRPTPVTPEDTYTGGTSSTAPSTLSTLPTIATAFTPQNAVWAVAMTTVLVILIALPSHLINITLEHGSDRFLAWRRRLRPVGGAAAPRPPVAWSGWPLAAAGVFVASIISSFVNPEFGFNGSSLRVFLSILVSFILDAVAGWFIVIWLVRRTAPNTTAAFRFVPATLVIVVAAVLFSRLTGFQPGIVFGLVAGVVFGSALALSEKAKVALVPLAYAFGLAIIGWVGYSILIAVNGSHPDAFVLFATETLSSIAIAGIAALPIALIPLKGLAGAEVFAWNRWAWAGSYAVGLFGFFFVLMPLPFSWSSVGLSIWTWAGIYLAYAVVAVIAWLVIVRPWTREPAETA